MKIVFWGSPEFSVPALEAINSSEHKIIAVISQIDKKRKRGSKYLPTPVKKRSEELGLYVRTTQSISDDIELQNYLTEIKPDIFIVVAFGQILPTNVLNIPKHGSWNGHASLLPRWRGAAPIQRAIMGGERNTGVCIMQMEKGLDTGPILIQESINIGLYDNFTDISRKLSLLTADLSLKALEIILNTSVNNNSNETVKLVKQNELRIQPTYANMISKQELLIDWNNSCFDIHRKIMALYPNAFTLIKHIRIKIELSIPFNSLKDSLESSKKIVFKHDNIISATAGEIILADSTNGLLVKCGEGYIGIRRAKLEGKKSCEGNSLIQQIKNVNYYKLNIKTFENIK